MDPLSIMLIAGGVMTAVRTAVMAASQTKGWEKLPRWLKYVIVNVLTLGTAVATGGATLPALAVGLTSGMAASGLHELTKDIGKAETAAHLKTDPTWSPGPLRQLGEILVPLDKSRLVAD